MSDAGRIASRKMFGEYAIYCDDKVVALVCDNQLFVKPTEKGRAYIEDIVEAPPYPGAKPYFLVEDRFEDREWISHLIRITAQEVPTSQPRKAKTRRIKPRTLSAPRGAAPKGEGLRSPPPLPGIQNLPP
jgi:TfoX/Sxy family transcriptional regulator of competence genes